jgi:succinyl-diaminopimelate desuccinylase
MDVVAAPEQKFHPIVEGQKMYGRGVYDMKMAIACYMQLMHELQGQLTDYDIGIMLTSDEEIGGMNGVRMLLQDGYRSNIALIPDGGFNWNIETAAKGVMQVQISAKGTSAHGSRPWMGENAIEKLLCALQDIREYFDEIRPKGSTYYATANIGIIQGGKATNMVPDSAEAKVDIRFPPSISADAIYDQLLAIVGRYDRVFVEKMQMASPSVVDVNLPSFHRFRALAKELYGIEVGTVSSHGASDARFFGEKDIPVLVIAPTGGDIHSDNEWIDLEDLVRFYGVVKMWVMEVARI